MKILVTGANGFIGAALCEHLSTMGHEVVPVVRRSMPIPKAQVITSHEQWACALRGCDSVVHLAGRAHVMREQEGNPLQAFRASNVDLTLALARNAAANGVKRFVFSSSIKTNGEHTAPGQLFRPDDEPAPHDAYAISKWEAEQALHSIAKDTGMEVVIVRPPLVYGPGVKANFAKLLQLVDQGVPLPLGSVRNSRSLVYLGNLVDALITCATHPAAAGQTYLVSDGDGVSTPQLVSAIALAMRRPDRVFSFPLSIMRFAARMMGKTSAVDRLTQSLEIDSSKIRKELGWRPPYSMQQGLQVTADWFLQSNNRDKVG